MKYWGFPSVCALWFCLTLFAPCLSAGLVRCGHGVACDWIEDTPTRGLFVMIHPRPITVTEDPMKDMPHSFVSPSGYWTVVFDTFKQYDAADSPFQGFDYVDLVGYMQHLMRPPGAFHVDDPMKGEKFSFNLLMLEKFNPTDDKKGTEDHGHTDTYHALLDGTDATRPNTGTLSYNFAVEGRHTEVFNTLDPGVPEPSTFVLAGAVLLFLRHRRCRAMIRRRGRERGCPPPGALN